jgi:hypothetical protein
MGNIAGSLFSQIRPRAAGQPAAQTRVFWALSLDREWSG